MPARALRRSRINAYRATAAQHHSRATSSIVFRYFPLFSVVFPCSPLLSCRHRTTCFFLLYPIPFPMFASVPIMRTQAPTLVPVFSIMRFTYTRNAIARNVSGKEMS
jgi:hypothetical protein